MNLPAGRTLSRTRALNDATMIDDPEASQKLFDRGMNIVVTASALSKLGVATPAAAIGGTVGLGINGFNDIAQPATIVGVVADPRFPGVREPLDATASTTRMPT